MITVVVYVPCLCCICTYTSRFAFRDDAAAAAAAAAADDDDDDDDDDCISNFTSEIRLNPGMPA